MYNIVHTNTRGEERVIREERTAACAQAYLDSLRDRIVNDYPIRCSQYRVAIMAANGHTTCSWEAREVD